MSRTGRDRRGKKGRKNRKEKGRDEAAAEWSYDCAMWYAVVGCESPMHWALLSRLDWLEMEVAELEATLSMTRLRFRQGG